MEQPAEWVEATLSYLAVKAKNEKANHDLEAARAKAKKR
jgi:hypothetical protein